MRPYRGIATLASLQILCFLLLSHLEPAFFLLHFYQTIIFLAILILLFYMEDRWAYMMGILAPAAWLVMSFMTGLLGAAGRQLAHLGSGAGITNAVSFLAALTAILSVLMIGLCARRWIREYAGLGKFLSTFAASFGIIAIYYGLLVVWFWSMIPPVIAKN